MRYPTKSMVLMLSQEKITFEFKTAQSEHKPSLHC